MIPGRVLSRGVYLAHQLDGISFKNVGRAHSEVRAIWEDKVQHSALLHGAFHCRNLSCSAAACSFGCRALPLVADTTLSTGSSTISVSQRSQAALRRWTCTSSAFQGGNLGEKQPKERAHRESWSVLRPGEMAALCWALCCSSLDKVPRKSEGTRSLRQLLILA